MILKMESHQFWWDMVRYKYINTNNVREVRITPKRIRFYFIGLGKEVHVGATKYNLKELEKFISKPEW